MIAASPDTASTLLWVVLLLAAIALSAFYSGSETGIYAVNRLRLELRAGTEGDGRARTLHRFLERRERALCVLLVGTNLANEAAAMLAQNLASGWVSGARAAMLTTLVLTPIVFVLGEALPKHVFRQHAERLAYRAAPCLALSRWLLLPLTAPVLPVAKLAGRWARARHADLRDLRHDEYALEGLLVAGGSSIESLRETALGIGNRRHVAVREVMVPLGRMRCLDAAAHLADLRRTLAEAPHTRYPLRESDGSFRSYVHFLDPFRAASGGRSLASFGRPLVELEPDCRLDGALARLETARGRVGVVRDGRGVTLGFVLAGNLVADLLSMDNVRP